MNFCSNCGEKVAEGSKFCGTCGAALQEEKASSTQEAGAYTYVAPEIKKPPIAKAIVSISLGGGAVFMAFMDILYSLIFAFTVPEAGFIFSLIFSAIIIPLSIVSIILGNGYLNANPERLRPAATAGRIMSIVSLAVCALGFFISIIGLVTI